MADSRRQRISNRSLGAIVAAFVFVALAIVGLLVAVLALGPAFSLRQIQGGAPRPTLAALVEPGRNVPSPAAAIEKGLVATWNEPSVSPTASPLLAKRVIPGGQPRAKWTATPVPTNTPIPSPTPNPTFVSSAYGLGDFMPEDIGRHERWIDVDLSEQKLVAYEGLIPVFETLVSTGTVSHPTVTGQFRIWLRFSSQDMNGYRLGYDYYLKDVPYVQYFYQDYALHGTFWHNNFGRPMSHGCVNLATPDAEWLFDWAGYGTLVNVHP